MSVIKIRQGQTVDLSLEFFQKDETGARLDLTGSTLSFAKNTFPTAPTLTATDAATGRAKLTMTTAQTNALSVNKSYHVKVSITQLNGTVRVYPTLTFTVVE